MQARATLKVQHAACDLAQINLGCIRSIAPVDGKVGQLGWYVNVGTQ